MLKPVTDPELLKQLGEPTGNLVPVSDPELLKQLNSTSDSPESMGSLKASALGLMSGIPGAETVVSGIKSLGKETYPEAHQELENLKDNAWDTNPIAYGVGKTTGMVGTGLALPVTGTLGGAAAIGAGLGAASGIDETSKLSDLPENVVKGVGTGAILGSVGHGIGKAIEAIPTVSKNLLASAGKNTTVEDIQSYLNNPEAIRNALSKEAIGGEIANTAKEIGTASGHLSDNARAILDPEKAALSPMDLKAVFDSATQKYLTEGRPITPADQTAVKTLQNLYGQIREVARTNNDTIPENILRETIDRLQAATKESSFGNPEASASQDAMKNISGKLNEVLRRYNVPYSEAMAPSAEAAGVASKLKDTFSLENNQPTDATFNKVGNVLKEGKLEGADLLDKVKNMTGKDFTEMIKNSDLAESFKTGGSGSAMKTLMAGLGFGVGKMTGVPFGGIGGAAVGRYAAEGVNGASIARDIMDDYLKWSANPQIKQISKAMQTYGPILINAAKIGGNQLAATHFVLATSKPDYQDAINDMQNKSETTTNTGIINQE